MYTLFFIVPCFFPFLAPSSVAGGAPVYWSSKDPEDSPGFGPTGVGHPHLTEAHVRLHPLGLANYLP